MPDVIEGILTPQDVFNLKVDTQRRWDSIDVPSNFSIPEPKFPDPLNTSTQMSVYDGLSSTDPKTKSLAEENLRQSIAQTPAVKYNNNFHIDTPYADAQKYYEGKFGFDPTRDNAQFYHENEYLAKGIPGRAWDNIWKGATRLVGGVVTKLGQTAGHLGSMVASSVMEIPDILTGSDNHNWLASWADNSFSKMMEGAEKHIKDVWAPVYKPSNWDQMGFFEKMSSGQAWSDDVVDGVAFMGEMIAASYLMGAGLSKVGWAAKAGELSIEGSSMAARLGRGVMLGATGSRNLGELGSWALNTVGESAFEAADGFKTIKQTLQDERAQGKNKFSDQEIENIAGSRAASRFRANLLAFSISNAFQNRFIFQPLLKRMGGRGFTSEKDLVAKGISVADDPIALAEAQVINPKFKGVLDRYLNIPKKLSDPTGALRFYGSRALMATMIEGFWEENAQLAIERLSAKGKLTLSSFTDQYLKQTNDAIRGNDPENAMSIGLGTLIGIGGTAIGAKAAKSKENPGVWGERKLMKLERQDMVNNYENMRKRYFSFGDVYEKDEKGNPIPEGNSFKIDPVKLAGLYKGLDDHMKSQYSMEEFKDPYLRKLAQNKLLSDFVFASKQAGISDTVIDRLEKLTNFSRQDLNKLGFNPDNKTDIGNTVDAYRKLSQIYEDVFTRRVSRPLDVRVADFEQSEFQRKGYLYNVKTDMLSISDVMQDYARLSSDKLLSKYKAGDETLGSIAQKHNSLQMELSSLLQTENVLSKASPYFNEYFKAKKESLKGQLKELEPLITDAALEDKMVFIPYSDDVTFLGSKEEYGKHIDEDGQFKQESLTEAREKFLQDFSEASKFSELQSALGMKTYVSDKISDKNKGHQNFQEYKAYIEAIQALDEKQDKKYTTQTSDDGKVYVVGPDGSEMTTVDTQEEADEIATELNTEKPEEPEEGGYRVVPYEDTFDLLDENGNIVANYQTEAAALEVAARRGKKVTTKPLVKKDVTKLNYEELLKEASAIIGRFTGAELTEEGIPNVANFLTDPSLELAREGLSQEETLVLNALVKAYNDRMKTKLKEDGILTTRQDNVSIEAKKADIEKRRQEELNNSITDKDKIIFGHPTIGKSYLKKNGANDFITLDDDYADEVNAFIDANRGTETRQEYKGRKPKEYNEFMLNLYDRLKVQAKKEGKRLFVSNTNILKERMSEFDKVITIPKDEFKKRFDARGATYGFEDWKSDIDNTVAKVDKSKVISTTGYLANLFQDKINAKYDAEYVDAVKKGEMTKEQAMQALEEIGRKDSSAYLEIDNTGKEGVKELFEENPELANEVYEATGFKTKTSENEITRGIKEILPFKVIGNYSNIEEGLTGRRQYSTVIDGNNYVFDISTYSYENEDGTFQSYYDIDFTVNGSEDIIGTGFFDKSEKAKHIIQAIISQNYGNDTIRFNVEESKKGKQRLLLYKRLMNQLGYNPSGEMEYALFYDIKTDKVNLTPQQKQQAQQLYAQYLSQNPNGSVEGFKAWKAKYDVEIAALPKQDSKSSTTVSSEEKAPLEESTTDTIDSIEQERLQKLLGSFVIPTERVVNSKGNNNGRTIRRELVSKVSSDGEIMTIKPKNTFTDDGSSLITSSNKMTLQEFKDLVYPHMTDSDIEFFEDTLEGSDFKMVTFKEARIGLKSHKGQTNIDVLMDGVEERHVTLNTQDLNAGYDNRIEKLSETTESSPLEETKEAAEGFLASGADNALNEAKSQDIKDVEDDFDNSLGCK